MKNANKILLVFIQVLLVTGGGYGPNDSGFKSTEILVLGSSNWKLVGDLPIAVFSIRGTSIDNKVLVTGIT